MKRVYFLPCAFVISSACFAVTAAADDFVPTLTLTNGVQSQEAVTQPAKPAAASRSTMEGKSGVLVTARWKVLSAATRPIKDVLVHFYVVRIARVGQAPPPLEPSGVLVESALTMDFDPGSTSQANINFRPEREGIYLIRIEADHGSRPDESVSFAAMDLIVK